MKRTRITPTEKRPSAAMLAKYADAKAKAIKALKDNYSAGAVTRAMELPPTLVLFWRREAGIPPIKAGQCRPTPAVGEVLA